MAQIFHDFNLKIMSLIRQSGDIDQSPLPADDILSNNIYLSYERKR
jgi:hypothetical protein